MMTLILFTAILFWSLAMLLNLAGTRITLRHLASFPPNGDMPFALHPVSILKPLKGVDPGLKQNLESFFHLDYPDYEIIFSVADAWDPAMKVIQELMNKFPQSNCRLVVGDVKVGINPKVNNLVRSWEMAKHDLMLISDSNIRVAPNYLKRIVRHIDQSVGVITAIVSGFSPKGIGAQLETVYLNTFYAKGMNLAFAVGKPCVVGKSMLFRRSQAMRFGGIRALSGYIAEDYMFGEMMRKLGLKVVLMTDPIPQFIGRYGLKDFWLRHLRWGRIRRAQAPVPFYLEPFVACVPAGLMGAWAFNHLLGLPLSQLLMLHLLVWSLCDFIISVKLQREVRVWLPIAWLLREVISIPLWVHTAASSVVDWRGGKYRISQGGAVTLVEHEKSRISLGRSYKRAPN